MHGGATSRSSMALNTLRRRRRMPRRDVRPARDVRHARDALARRGRQRCSSRWRRGRSIAATPPVAGKSEALRPGASRSAPRHVASARRQARRGCVRAHRSGAGRLRVLPDGARLVPDARSAARRLGLHLRPHPRDRAGRHRHRRSVVYRADRRRSATRHGGLVHLDVRARGRGHRHPIRARRSAGDAGARRSVRSAGSVSPRRSPPGPPSRSS